MAHEPIRPRQVSQLALRVVLRQRPRMGIRRRKLWHLGLARIGMDWHLSHTGQASMMMRYMHVEVDWASGIGFVNCVGLSLAVALELALGKHWVTLIDGVCTNIAEGWTRSQWIRYSFGCLWTRQYCYCESSQLDYGFESCRNAIKTMEKAVRVAGNRDDVIIMLCIEGLLVVDGVVDDSDRGNVVD